MLKPNTTHFPSEPTNDPVMHPFIGMEGHRLHFEHPLGVTALGSDIGCTDFADQSAPDNLRALRLQFPYLEVIPVPARSTSIALGTAVSLDVAIPDGMVAMILRGNADYYVSFNGAAGIPTVGGVDTQSVYKPEGYVMYVGNKRSFSAIAPNAGTIVTAMFYPLVPIRPI